MKKCSKCNISKEYYLFYKKKKNKDGLNSQCISCIKKYNSIYRKNNKKKLVEASKNWRMNNPEKYKEWKRFYHKKNKENPLYRLKISLRRHLKRSIKQTQWVKKSSYNKALGCSLDKLKNHLESKFTKGMTWDNYGFYGWHIDHIIPLSSAKTEEELYKLSHYTNLQPLWALDNLKKGAS